MGDRDTGGRRRIDRVLARGFAEDLADLPLEEIRRRRDECLAEREYLSFVRRLVQGRLDILRAEVERRATGRPGPIIDELPSILAPDGPRSSRGEAPRLAPLPEAEMAEGRRHVERLLADVSMSDPSALDDEELGRAIGLLEEEERSVSDARAAVIGVHDRLQEEIKRRYREDLSQASRG